MIVFGVSHDSQPSIHSSLVDHAVRLNGRNFFLFSPVTITAAVLVVSALYYLLRPHLENKSNALSIAPVDQLSQIKNDLDFLLDFVDANNDLKSCFEKHILLYSSHIARPSLEIPEGNPSLRIELELMNTKFRLSEAITFITQHPALWSCFCTHAKLAPSVDFDKLMELIPQLGDVK